MASNCKIFEKTDIGENRWIVTVKDEAFDNMFGTNGAKSLYSRLLIHQ